jgi:hypothetical protein
MKISNHNIIYSSQKPRKIVVTATKIIFTVVFTRCVTNRCTGIYKFWKKYLPSAHKTQFEFRSHFSGEKSASYAPGNTVISIFYTQEMAQAYLESVWKVIILFWKLNMVSILGHIHFYFPRKIIPCFRRYINEKFHIHNHWNIQLRESVANPDPEVRSSVTIHSAFQ